jgi:hypothetical protein
VIQAVSVPLYSLGVLPALELNAPLREDRIERADPDRFTLVLKGERVLRNTFPEVMASTLQGLYQDRPRSGSKVLEEGASPNEYRCRVRMDQAMEFVLLKVSYHPYWKVAVDGVRADVVPLAPNLMGVAAGPGTHEIVFRYRNPLSQKIAAAGALVLWCAWVLLQFRGAGRRPPDAPATDSVPL